MTPNSKPIISSAALAVSLALAACVTAPPDNSLADARAAVGSATANPDVARYDALDLAMAQQQLANAESAAQRDAPAMADHEAYLAIRTAKLAEVRADQIVAQQRVAVADGVRAQAQLDARAQIDHLNVEPTPRSVMVVLTDDYFEPGQAQLLPGAGKILDGLAEFLVAHPERRVRVEGHSDSNGAPESNLALPLHRAEAVRMALVARGVDPVRSEAVAYGPENPLAGHDNPADSHFIRGVEILLSDSRGQIASR
jgi:outer membrane protein OmpA-like peptidoglycan-associated protein